MEENAVLLVDKELLQERIRQWVTTCPYHYGICLFVTQKRRASSSNRVLHPLSYILDKGVIVHKGNDYCLLAGYLSTGKRELSN